MRDSLQDGISVMIIVLYKHGGDCGSARAGCDGRPGGTNFTKAAAGTYMCEVTWEDLSYSMNSEVVELTEAVHGHAACGEACTHDASHE